MKRTLALVLALLMLTGALAGCNTGTPAETTDTGAPAETTPAETTPAETTAAAETEPVEEEIPAYKQEIVKEYENFTVTLSAPTVVFQGGEDDQTWGHHQFPNLRRTTTGMLLASWAYGEDKVGGQSIGYSKISLNGGKSWVPNTGGNAVEQTILMSNGKYFAGFRSAGTPHSTHLDAYTPIATWGEGKNVHKIYFAEDVAEDPVSVEKRITAFAFTEYDPETKTATAVDCTVNWPYAPIVLYPGDFIYSLSGWFGLSGANVIITEDGTLFTCIYCPGFDSFADSKEESINDYAGSGKSHVFVFASVDCGRTWDLTAQITPGEEYGDSPEGYDEPKMIQMPDGSFLMLMRTGSNNPMYVTRSTDGYTWTTPEVFDDIGVLPQLNQFANGVTVATYGRPYLRVRLTDDPTGTLWEDPIEIPLPGPKDGYNQSCFYTNMLRLDDNTILMIYTSFRYPNRDGVGVRTILTRTITVTPKN